MPGPPLATRSPSISPTRIGLPISRPERSSIRLTLPCWMFGTQTTPSATAMSRARPVPSSIILPIWRLALRSERTTAILSGLT